LAGILRGLPLAVVEVGRDGDDGLLHLLAQVTLGRALQVLEDHGRDLGRRVLFTAALDLDKFIRPAGDFVGDEFLFLGHLVVAPAHEPLDGENGVAGVGDGLAFGDLADQPFPLLADGHDRRRDTAALGVRDDGHLFAFADGDHGIRGSEVDSDDLITGHGAAPFRGALRAAAAIALRRIPNLGFRSEQTACQPPPPGMARRRKATFSMITPFFARVQGIHEFFEATNGRAGWAEGCHFGRRTAATPFFPLPLWGGGQGVVIRP